MARLAQSGVRPKVNQAPIVQADPIDRTFVGDLAVGTRIYLGRDRTHYLYLSDDDIYWQPGSGVAVKLNT